MPGLTELHINLCFDKTSQVLVCFKSGNCFLITRTGLYTGNIWRSCWRATARTMVARTVWISMTCTSTPLLQSLTLIQNPLSWRNPLAVRAAVLYLPLGGIYTGCIHSPKRHCYTVTSLYEAQLYQQREPIWTILKEELTNFYLWVLSWCIRAWYTVWRESQY